MFEILGFLLAILTYIDFGDFFFFLFLFVKSILSSGFIFFFKVEVCLRFLAFF